MIVNYFLAYFWVFGFSDLRYLMAVVPLFSIVAAKVLMDFSERIKYVVYVILAAQFSLSLIYISYNRNVSEYLKEGFAFIQQQVPADDLVMYPEYCMLEYGNRKMAWNRLFNFSNILWPKNQKELKENLTLNNLNWIAVKKERIYDSLNGRHFGGYPATMINFLDDDSFFKVVFDNSEMKIYKRKN